MPAGLPGGTAISSTFVAKSTGASASTSPPSVSLAMFFSSAEAKTSTGAPSVICVTRSEDPAKFSAMSTSGLAFSNSAASSVNVAVSDAAAKTVIEPLRSDAAVLVALEAGASAAGVEHAARAKTADAASARPAAERMRPEMRDAHSWAVPVGVSMMTVVAFTTAMATEPSFEAEFAHGFAAHERDDPMRAALQFDLRHDGVHRDRGHEPDQVVARRTTDLRRDRPGARRSSVRGARGSVHRRRCGLRHPWCSRAAPLSIQRRTVSSLTPRKLAASFIRICGITVMLCPRTRKCVERNPRPRAGHESRLAISRRA